MITVVGKDAEKTAYFDFGTRGGSPFVEIRSRSETRDVIVPHLTETWAAHSRAISALIKAVERPTDDLLK